MKLPAGMALALLGSAFSPIPIRKVPEITVKSPAFESVCGDAVALRQLEPHREETLLVWIPIKDRALYACRKNSRAWRPLDFCRRYQLVIHRLSHEALL